MPKTPKMKTCSQCGQQYAANAGACPYCGARNKKPVYKRPWFWILVVVLVLVAAALAGGGGGDEEEDRKIGEVGGSSTSQQQGGSGGSQQGTGSSSQAAASSGGNSSGGEVQTVYHVGDILHDGDMDIVYMSSGTYAEDNEFLQPAEGMKYVFVQFAFLNTSEDSDSSVSMYSFEGYADGYSVDPYYGGEDNLSATLSPGRSTSGYLYFEVPQGAQEIEVEYETNMFTEDKITFAFEGDMDSGYTLPKNTVPAAGALQPGGTTSFEDLNIVYLSCTKTVSDNMFLTPKAGCHYVTVELEFENTSDSDQTVSSMFGFGCYADGIHCDQVFTLRDDDIDAEMSPGRKAKGTVTFEVPDNASVVEVEYVSGVWTAERAVFDASSAK